MSDAQNSGIGSSDNPSNSHGSGQGLPARNMADIARMFLDGARPAHPAGKPKRTPPQKKSNARPSAAPVPDPAMPEGARECGTATVMLALAAGAHEGATSQLLLEAAHGLAEEHATTVALISMLSANGQAGRGDGKRTFVTDIVGVESADELPLIRAAGDSGPADMQIARALHRLRPAVGLWLIASPCPDSHPFPAMASILHHWLLACPTDNEGLVAGYQFLKRAWVKGSVGVHPVAPSVYLLSEDYAHAAVVHKRLRKAAQEFLKTDLALAGAGPVRTRAVNGAGSVHQAIRVLSIPCQSGSPPEDALWATVLDELCPMSDSDEQGSDNEIEAALDHVQNHASQLVKHSAKASELVLDHLAQVLDPEERAALALDFDEPAILPEVREPAVESIRGGDRPAAPVLLKPAGTAPPLPHPSIGADPGESLERVSPIIAASQPFARSSSEKQKVKIDPSVEPANSRTPQIIAPTNQAGPTLRAFDAETVLNRDAQWQAVERSIWDLSPRSALLDAKPPMSWATETCIAIDAQGRLNVWTLYKDGVSWFALRESAHEHKNILALTRRDLTIDKNADVSVHIILPLEEKHADESPVPHDPIPTLLRTPAKNIFLYRLRQVEWHNRRGIVVVPIA